MGIKHHNLSTFIECVEHSLQNMVKIPNSLKISPNVRYLVCMLAPNRVYARTCEKSKTGEGVSCTENHRDQPPMLTLLSFPFPQRFRPPRVFSHAIFIVIIRHDRTGYPCPLSRIPVSALLSFLFNPVMADASSPKGYVHQ